jgi:hypothetical protein
MNVDDAWPSRPPTRCPYGHPLTAGLVQLGWQPCECPVALAHHRGHTTYTCRTCESHGWTMVYFEPEHIRTAHEADAELEWIRAALARLEKAGVTGSEIARYRRALIMGEQTVAALRARGT